ncbi:peroxide stress protein YaaA [Subtercola sp. PAMC28395]|uniref:YaaA family protein n=1 Tax=Subtercola sp. PAMC28395 TaxID=2846775 RepID=UPI001C0E1675|nr:peroxide stress protein YaaA [Subtercola sp. PAMC28395]QWT23553.1 peroxide stress protein YaaA [Subtercola sp. PAMC28395]
MIILLPPSETKRDGGTDIRLDLTSLAFGRLRPRRAEVVRAVRSLARDSEATIAALKLGRTQHDEVLRNRRLALAPTMPALDRYTGVVFDGLGASTLSKAQRAFAFEHVFIHSALFGPISSGDLIPAYRLSHDSRLRELPKAVTLKNHWAKPTSAVLSQAPGLLLDLRSEGYVDFGPVDSRPNSFFLRVFTVDDSGQKRALNHFNKKAKGELTRAIIESGVDFASVDEIIEWAQATGFDLRRFGDSEIALTV